MRRMTPARALLGLIPIAMLLAMMFFDQADALASPWARATLALLGVGLAAGLLAIGRKDAQSTTTITKEQALAEGAVDDSTFPRRTADSLEAVLQAELAEERLPSASRGV